MKEYRSATQVLFGFLPEQTVDLKGGVWKVREWRSPVLCTEIDDASLRRELVRQAMPWANTAKDGRLVENLHQGWQVKVYSVDKENGVQVEPFPKLWMCKACSRIHAKADANCVCGFRGHLGQLPFVGYHDACGNLKEPWLPKCKEHREVRIRFPGTASASEIVFDCPTCGRILQKGFGTRRCDCGGDGALRFTVHRAASVYTPRSIVIVNPPSREKIRRITEAGGPPKALEWVVGGMVARTLDDSKPDVEAVRRQLADTGLPEQVIEDLVSRARESGGISEGTVGSDLPESRRAEAENQAVTVALAVSESRIRIADLVEATEPMSDLGGLYRDQYPVALRKAGLETIELIERFPVLTGNFGYTRGDGSPQKSRLQAFRSPRGDRTYHVYGDLAQTEALFVRLDPLKVLAWLTSRGHTIRSADGLVEARTSILRAAELPPLDGPDDQTDLGTDLLNLVHSYAHRFIRIAAVYAGIDRDALSELLVPLHLGFFVYAAARGEFVLGGLQAVFETELQGLLHAFVHEDHRCALDPGCIHAGGACMACIHLGEPSCRYFNRFLNRSTLFGRNGFLGLGYAE